jgi:hypothetical protein
MTRRFPAPLAMFATGLVVWAYGVTRLRPSAIGSYGLLASAGAWFVLGLAMLLGAFVIELRRREPRSWLLGLCLFGLIIAIHTTVPIIYGGTPEYAWVYKHIGVAQTLGRYGHVTDPLNIYQRWPALFAATAAVGRLGHVNPLWFAAWAPVAFELAEALVLIGVFRLLTRDHRVAFLAALLYVGLVAGMGQDYLSPQAFSYLVWLGIILVLLRWLRAPVAPDPSGLLGRLRAPLLAGLEGPPETTAAMRAFAVALVALLFFAVVAAHQLTPYMILLGVGVLTLLDLVRPRWLVLLLLGIAIAYLAPRYSLIAEEYGGVFSGLNPIKNAAGTGAYHAGAEAVTAWSVRGLAAFMWLFALAAIARRRRALGRVAIPAALAFSPFLVLLAQGYGGEAIYRIYLFSAPWCALLISSTLFEVRAPLRRAVSVGLISAVVVFAGLQGLYGPVRVNAFTPAELAASEWLYRHVPRDALVVLPVDNYPGREMSGAQFAGMPAHVELDVVPWMDVSNFGQVERWITGLGKRIAYVVVSRNMDYYADFFGPPNGFGQLKLTIGAVPGVAVVYRNADVTIYRLDFS